MSYNELYYEMLPKHFWRKLTGFYDLINTKERQEWDRIRWSTCLLLNIHLPKGKSIKPTDLIKFDWDQKNVEQTKDDFEKFKNKAEYIKKMEDYGK